MTSNNFQLIGNIGNDVELIQTQNSQYCRLSVATRKYYKPKDKESVTETTWHSLTFWGKSAKYVADNYAKGQKVTVIGEIKYRNQKIGDKEYTLPNLQPSQIESLTAKK